MESILKKKSKSRNSPVRRSKAIEAEDGTLTDRAYRELEERIVTLQLLPGTVLSEQALALRLKIGRTPIREALQRLARDGLVVIMPRRGIMVSEINLKLQLRLLEVRRELERLMASLAAERATPDERSEFSEIAAAMLAAATKADPRPKSAVSTGCGVACSRIEFSSSFPATCKATSKDGVTW